MNLLIQAHFYDIALRDVGLLAGALALARLAAVYGPTASAPIVGAGLVEHRD